MDRILGCAIGKHIWMKENKSFKTVMEVGITMSDEAFTLLIMENVWDKVFEVNGTTKYTGGVGMGNKPNSGWTNEGLARFNQLSTLMENNQMLPYRGEVEEQV